MTTHISPTVLFLIAGTAAIAEEQTNTGLTYGPRPAYLISQMDDSPLKKS